MQASTCAHPDFQTVISATVGLFTGIILYSLSVDLSLVFALLSFVLNFIPNLGSVIATLLPVPIILLDPNQTWLTAGLAIGLIAAVHVRVRGLHCSPMLTAVDTQMTIGNFIEPKIFGKTVDLHPVTVLAALVFWGSVWGIVGALLSVRKVVFRTDKRLTASCTPQVPLTAILKVVLLHTDHPMTQFVGHALVGKISVYQKSLKKPTVEEPPAANLAKEA